MVHTMGRETQTRVIPGVEANKDKEGRTLSSNISAGSVEKLVI